MPDSGSAELAGLLSRLSTQVPGDPADASPPRPSAGEAMALYYVTARVVELQLQLAERGDSPDLRRELATTRELLEQTRRVLADALGPDGDAPVSALPGDKPRLSVVHGDKSGPRRSRKPS